MAQATRAPRRGPVTAPARTDPRTKASGPDFWDRLSGRAQHAVCIVFLLAVSLLFFAPIHFGGKTLIAGDTIQWRAMAEAIQASEEATGEQALWTPSAFAGMPAYTIEYDTPVPQLDDVPDWLRRFLWPTSHLFVLLLGTYLLVVFLTGQKLSGVLAACAYGLTTYLPVLLVAGHNTKFIALCYAPWLLLAFAFALRRPGLLAGLLFAAALALSLRANHVQITYYLAFLLGIWWLVEAVGAARNGRVKVIGASTAWLALGAVLGVLMIAQPYLLLREYKALSTRGGGGLGSDAPAGLAWEYAMNWSQSISELLTLFVAHAFGGSQLYWGPKVFTGGPHYLGGVALLLAVFALLRVRRNVAWGLGLAALAMVLFSLGENLALLNRPMFYYFPLFGTFRAPETWLSVAALALAVLAGLGAAALARREETPQAEAAKTRTALAASGVAAGFVLLLLLLGGAFFSFEKAGELPQLEQAIASQTQQPRESPQVAAYARQYYQEQVVGPRKEAFRGDAFRTIVFLALSAGLIFLYRRGTLPGWGLQAGLALLVLVDLWGVGRRYLNDERLVERQAVESQIPTYDFDQFLLERQRAAGGAGHFRVLAYEGQSPMQYARPSYYYESLGGYSAAKVRLYQDFVDHVLFDPETGLPNEQALDLLNTRYVVAPGAVPDANVVFQGQQGMTVSENADAVPRAFFVGDVEVIGSAEETWARLRSPAFDPTRTAILSEPISFQPTPLGPGSRTAVALQQYTNDRIVWRVQTDAPRLLVASEIYYPAGWKAYVDGREAPIHRADYLLRAVPVPAGEHTVEMRFEPATERLSFWLSAVSTLLVYGGLIILLGMSLMRRRTPDETPAAPHA